MLLRFLPAVVPSIFLSFSLLYLLLSIFSSSSLSFSSSSFSSYSFSLSSFLVFALLLLGSLCSLVVLVVRHSRLLESTVSLLCLVYKWYTPVQVKMLKHVLEKEREWEEKELEAQEEGEGEEEAEVNQDGVVMASARIRARARFVTNAIDDFCWNKGYFLITLGDVKAEVLRQALAPHVSRVRLVVELGSYIGYSTLHLGSLLPVDAELHSVDPDALGHAVSAKLISTAFHVPGNSKKKNNSQTRKHCTFVPIFGYSSAYLRTLARRGAVIDVLFVDHVKELYLDDVKLAVSLGLLKRGSIVIADNVLFPGAPEYKSWMLANDRFETTVHDTFLEYSKKRRDQVLVSIYKGELDRD